MRSQFISKRLRSKSLNTVPPAPASEDYSVHLADAAAHIIYRSPFPSQADLPVFVINASAFPDHAQVDYEALLPYVLARLPDEDELIGGKGYEVVFFAGAEDGGSATPKKERPGWGWFLQAYHVLTRAMRKRLQKLYVVHEKTWVRLMIETFSTVVSPKFRKKIVHGRISLKTQPTRFTLTYCLVSCLSALAFYIPIEDLLISPSAYLYDRRCSPDIHVPYASGRRAFGVVKPLPTSSTGVVRLPRVLRESTNFLFMDQNIKTEGIFRVNALSTTVDILKEAYERGQKFIVWRAGDCVLTYSHWKEGIGNVMVNDIEQTEGFGVHPAAGLIKRWIAELRDPIFPPNIYPELKRLYGDLGTPIEISRLHQLIATDALLNSTSRSILNMYLLPLLSKTAGFQDWNHMTPYNLAVCFAPNLVRSPDPAEDVEMANLVRRILEAAISQWKALQLTCYGADEHLFGELLRAPEYIFDREDPLEDTNPNSRRGSSQTDGIIFVDNESDDDQSQTKPTLPPRPGTTTQARNPLGVVRRKPAPSVPPPPRYSTIIMDDALADTLPAYNENLVGTNAVSASFSGYGASD